MSSIFPQQEAELRGRLAQIRAEISLTQQEFAEKIGLSADQWGRIERLEAPLSADHARAIQKAFGYLVDYVMDGKGPKRVSEHGPVFRIGEDKMLAPVMRRTAYHCGTCFGEVAQELLICPHCGGRLKWTGNEER